MKRRKILWTLLILIGMLGITSMPFMAETIATKENLERESTVIAGEIIVDGTSQIRYLYSEDITITKTVFQNLKSALNGTDFYGLVPEIASETTAVKGFFRFTQKDPQDVIYKSNTNYFGGISHDWSSAATVAKKYYSGTVVSEKNINLYDHNKNYKNNVDSDYRRRQQDVNEPLQFDKRIVSTLSVDTKSDWVTEGNAVVSKDTVTFNSEATIVIYTSMQLKTAEKIAEEKAVADKTAADSVVKKIEEIGTVENTESIKVKINAARAAYEALTSDQKKLVGNYSKLTDAETRYGELKKAAEETRPAEEKITISKKPTINKPKAAKGKITVSWNKFNNKGKKNKAIWKKIKNIEVQCSTKKNFPTDETKKKTIRKTKKSVKFTGLKKKTTYFVRVRYCDGAGGYSKWSAVKQIKTK